MRAKLWIYNFERENQSHALECAFSFVLPTPAPTRWRRSLLAPMGHPNLSIIDGARDEATDPAAVYLSTVSEGSRASIAWALSIAQELMPGLSWQQVEYRHMVSLRSRLADAYAPATCNKVLAAVRGVLKEAWGLGMVSMEQYGLAARVKPVRGVALPSGRALAAEEIEALRAAAKADATPAGARDLAMIEVLYVTGMRRNEIAGLDLCDWTPDGAGHQGWGVLVVRHGKGGKQRRNYLPPIAEEALHAWRAIRGEDPGRLFRRVFNGGRIGSGLTGQAVWRMLAKRAKEAGIAPVGAHDMRRTTITELLRRGGDLSMVSRIVGHSNVQTTMRYDRRKDSEEMGTIELLLDG